MTPAAELKLSVPPVVVVDAGKTTVSVAFKKNCVLNVMLENVFAPVKVKVDATLFADAPDINKP